MNPRELQHIWGAVWADQPMAGQTNQYAVYNSVLWHSRGDVMPAKHGHSVCNGCITTHSIPHLKKTYRGSSARRYFAREGKWSPDRSNSLEWLKRKAGFL